MKKSALFILMFLFNISMIFAQNTVGGILVDGKSNERLAFVNVGLIRTADTVLVTGSASDYNGVFKLSNVPNGSYILKVSAIGYETFKRDLEVNESIDLGVIKIIPGTTLLDDIVVTESKPLFVNEGEKTLYNVKEDPTIQTGTVSDALQNAPGVEVDVEGNITLRGVSSVEIWINGQPSHLNEENLKTYLQQMPANSLEKIEVITNPSARYASKSDGGIINIVTSAKIQKNEFVSFGARGSSSPDISPWVSYVWANDKITINAFANFNYYHWKSDDDGYEVLFKDSDTTSYKHYSEDSKDNNIGTGFNFSMDYNIDTMNTMSVWIGGWPHWDDGSSFNDMYRYQYDTLGRSLFHYTTDRDNDGYNMGYYGGAYYQHKFNNEGHQISFELNGNLYNGYDNSSYKKLYLEGSLPNVDYKTKSKYFDLSYGANVDYTIPYIKDGEIGVGVSYSHDPDSHDYTYDTLNNGTYVNDEIRSRDRNGYENSFDTYFTIQQKFGNFTIKPGIRMEYSKIGCDITGYEVNNHSNDYLNWRPSLHVSYRTKSMHNFKLSYARRIGNPRSRYMTDFREYSEESFSTGNLNIEPTFTNSFEAGWTKYWNKFGSVGVTVYHRNSKNTVNTFYESEFDPFFGRIVSYSYPVNVGKSHNTGAEFNVTYRPNGMLNVRLYANLYDSYLKENDREKENVTYSLRLNLWTKVWNKLEIHASSYYRSASEDLYSERKANYAVNCGLRADFFDKKMSLHLNVNDIFNWNKWDGNINTPTMISYSSSKYNSRTVSLGVVFRFGKMELEKKAKQGGEEMSPESGER